MPYAHDPTPENGAAILALAQRVLPPMTWRPMGKLHVEYDRGDWRVKDDRGHSWRVLPGCPSEVLFEVETLP